MADITFTFLIIDSTYQDQISFDVNETMMLETVIVQICNHLGVEKFEEVRNEFGSEIEELDIQMGHIADKYGQKLKLIIRTPEEIEDDITTSVKDDVVSSEEMAELIAKKVVDVALKKYVIDEEGYAEFIIIPLVESYLTQLRVKFKVDRPAKDLFTRVSITCGHKPHEVKVVPLSSHETVISDLSQKLNQIAEKYGPVFVLLPLDEEISSSDNVISTWFSELLDSYS